MDSETPEIMDDKTDNLPGWAAKLLVAALSVLSVGISGWALSTTNSLQMESVNTKADLRALKENYDLKSANTKDVETRLERDIREVKDKVDRIADAVGVRSAVSKTNP